MNKQKQTITVLIHGLWMTGMEMSLMALRLRRRGFPTYQFRYASRKAAVETNALRLARFASNLPSDSTVNFVCHSLGGIVLCHMLANHSDSIAGEVGRVVLLGSPVNGSSFARMAAGWKTARYAAGESLHALVRGCPPCCTTVQAGMIAGTVNLGMGMFSLGRSLPADGLVALKDTRADWLRDHVTVNTNHIGLLFSVESAKLVANFLKSGTFETIR